MSQPPPTCTVCLSPIVRPVRGRPRKYCVPCAALAKREQDRGRRPDHSRACKVCRTWIQARKDRRGHVQECCSDACRLELKRRNGAQRRLAVRVLHARSCVQCAVPFTTSQPKKVACSAKCWARWHYDTKFAPHTYQPRKCRTCEAAFVPTSKQSRVFYCPSCRLARQQHQGARGGGARGRALLYGVHFELVDNGAVFRRDRWVCQLCGQETLKEERGTWHPLAPEIDHIIPMSRGGPHVFWNVQCAHRKCNGAKHAK